MHRQKYDVQLVGEAKHDAAEERPVLEVERSPRFNEFVIATEEDPEQLNGRLLEQKIIGGVALRRWYPELGNATLWCVIELTTREQINQAATVLAQTPAAAAAR